MEEKDLELIRKHIGEDEELRQLWHEHQELEAKLDTFEAMKYLGSEDELRRKQLQKLKLSGKDRIEEVLRKYRKS
ncbi:MAG: hypothetical protein BWY87_00761 [Deltaproteobacteria bacterium ADurb.Bin510]|nr:MAG: hypothetical protein BWY87_00761 [Deltaproteobacteria bacterium ADurb.Bin510]